MNVNVFYVASWMISGFAMLSQIALILEIRRLRREREYHRRVICQLWETTPERVELQESLWRNWRQMKGGVL